MDSGAAFENRLGYDATARSSMTWDALLHPEERDEILRQIGHLIPYPGSSIRSDFRMRHAQGTWINVEAILSHLGPAEGGDGILLQAQDVTRFKIAEEALRFAEEKYRGIFENALEGIYQLSPEGRFLSANSSLARILGYESPIHLIHSVRDVATEVYLDQAAHRRFLEAVEKDGLAKDYESKVRRRDGTEIWVSENAHAVRDAAGKVLFYEGTAEDVTARRTAQEALRRSEERYALAAMGSNGGLWEWDIQAGRWATWNDARPAFYGATRYKPIQQYRYGATWSGAGSRSRSPIW